MELSSRIHLLIFLWTPKGFISPEYFLNFCQTCMSHHGYGKISNLWWKFMHYLDYWEIHLRAKKIDLFIFAHVPKQTLHQAEGNYPFHPNSVFWRIFSSSIKEGGLWSWKMNKIKLARVLVTSFDKFHHLCNLYIFGFCFVVP